MQKVLFPLLLMMSVLVLALEVLQNQPVLKLLLLLYTANNSRHLWIIHAVHNKDQLSAHWLYWSYVKKKYKLNMPFLVSSYPAKASALLSNTA